MTALVAAAFFFGFALGAGLGTWALIDSASRKA